VTGFEQSVTVAWNDLKTTLPEEARIFNEKRRAETVAVLRVDRVSLFFFFFFFVPLVIWFFRLMPWRQSRCTRKKLQRSFNSLWR